MRLDDRLIHNPRPAGPRVTQPGRGGRGGVLGIPAPAPIAYRDCEHCGGSGLTRGSDQENQCARCALRRHDEQAGR